MADNSDAPTTGEGVHLGIEGGVATITLDRPSAMNSLDVATKEALLKAVTDVAADRTTRRLAHEEGLLVGTSSGANVYAALELAKTLKPGQRVVTLLCDTGERYLC